MNYYRIILIINHIKILIFNIFQNKRNILFNQLEFIESIDESGHLK